MNAPRFKKLVAQLPSLNQPHRLQLLDALHPAAGLDRVIAFIAEIRAPGRRCPDCSCERCHRHGEAKQVGVHRNTTFRWRHRFLHWVKYDRPRQLTGIVEADETFLLESQKGSRKLDREPRKRGGKAPLRGISMVGELLLSSNCCASRSDSSIGNGDIAMKRAPGPAGRLPDTGRKEMTCC